MESAPWSYFVGRSVVWFETIWTEASLQSNHLLNTEQPCNFPVKLLYPPPPSVRPTIRENTYLTVTITRHVFDSNWTLQVKVITVVTPCSNVVGYQRFGGPSIFSAWTSETLVFYHNPEGFGLNLHPEDGGSMDLWNVWYPTITLHGVTTQKTSMWSITTVKISNLVIGCILRVFVKTEQRHIRNVMSVSLSVRMFNIKKIRNLHQIRHKPKAVALIRIGELQLLICLKLRIIC